VSRRAQALFETTAEVLTGLRKVHDDFEHKSDSTLEEGRLALRNKERDISQ
jgi:hypothetical protein